MASEPCTVTAITVEWTRSAVESARLALGVCTSERKATCNSCSASKKPRPRCCSCSDSLMKSVVPSSSRSWILRMAVPTRMRVIGPCTMSMSHTRSSVSTGKVLTKRHMNQLVVTMERGSPTASKWAASLGSSALVNSEKRFCSIRMPVMCLE